MWSRNLMLDVWRSVQKSLCGYSRVVHVERIFGRGYDWLRSSKKPTSACNFPTSFEPQFLYGLTGSWTSIQTIQSLPGPPIRKGCKGMWHPTHILPLLRPRPSISVPITARDLIAVGGSRTGETMETVVKQARRMVMMENKNRKVRISNSMDVFWILAPENWDRFPVIGIKSPTSGWIFVCM